LEKTSLRLPVVGGEKALKSAMETPSKNSRYCMILKSRVLNSGFFCLSCLYNGMLPTALLAAPDGAVKETVLMILFSSPNEFCDCEIGTFQLFVLDSSRSLS